MAKTIKDLKPEEKDEILSFIGVDDFDNFKDTFQSKFFTKESAISNEEIQTAITGKRFKEVSAKLHKVAKFLNPDISLNEFNKKTIEENIPEIESLLATRFDEFEQKSKSGNDKRVNDLEKTLQEKEKSLNAYKELAEKEASEKAQIKNEYESGMKSYKIKHQYDQLKSKLSWIDEPTDVQRIGFDTKISSSYQFDLDEKENLQIFTADGKPIPSKSRAGQMADPFEVLDMELDVNKLKKNNNAKQIVINNFKPENKGRELLPSYQKRLREIGK